MDAGLAIEQIACEYMHAIETEGEIKSAHEGYAVILEKLDGLKKIVWQKPKDRDIEQMRKEAAHAAAMALRFIVDVT
ncbi:MAG: hypothetical protein E3J94_06985 [Desulfobacteraceae bacterium]|nr:MAG: hypothetical protein E3J94_06985 [Desulfobacteraceae bacterium]